jgi:hypothetical protein
LTLEEAHQHTFPCIGSFYSLFCSQQGQRERSLFIT